LLPPSALPSFSLSLLKPHTPSFSPALLQPLLSLPIRPWMDLIGRLLTRFPLCVFRWRRGPTGSSSIRLKVSVSLSQGSRTASTLSAATLASLGGASSRRGSCDTSFSVETEASIREMKVLLQPSCDPGALQDSLAEAEEKYRRAMVSNAQLHNDKTTLMFQVENLREELSDMEELLWEARRRGEDSSKELERERQAHSVLKVQFTEMEESLRRSNELLTVRTPRTQNYTQTCSMILDNRLVVLGLSPSGKLKSLSEETINQDVPSTLESKASSSETDVEQKDLCSLDVGPQSPDEDAPGFSEVGPGESMVETERLSPERSADRTEAKLETQAAATSFPESLGRPEQCQKQSPGEPLLGATQTPTACPEHPQRTSPFVPEDTWTSLENTVQDLLQGLEDTPGFVVEISRIFSEILICLHQWISDLENTLRNGPGKESCQNEGGGHALMWPVVGSRPSMKTWLHLASPAREPAERPGCVGGDSASQRVGSASERMENQSGSSNRASSTPHHHTASTDRGTWSRHLQMDAESGASPAGCCFHPPASPVNNSSADFVFVDSYFAEPQSRSELSLGKTSDSQSHLQLPASESKELRGNRAAAAHSAAGQSSSVRRFMEVTAEEIRALAVPELALLGLQEGRRLEGSSVGSVEELSVEDMDSCEEADEEEEEIRAPPPQQQDRSRTEAEVHAVVPPLGTAEPEPDHEGPSLDSRKHDNTDCKIS
uniref:Uncharacterized protein n=1 Tax=Fundulus heteroclitus TaxID=8078 RepID=A0A3Q2NMZ4_FUNHE